MIATSDLLKEVERLHHRPDDFDDGDLINRLWNFDRYRLQAVALSDLDAEEWDCDPDTAQEYAAMHSPFPPIVFDPKERSIIDGTHRVNAALRRGDTHIWAYVGG